MTAPGVQEPVRARHLARGEDSLSQDAATQGKHMGTLVMDSRLTAPVTPELAAQKATLHPQTGGTMSPATVRQATAKATPMSQRARQWEPTVTPGSARDTRNRRPLEASTALEPTT